MSARRQQLDTWTRQQLDRLDLAPGGDLTPLLVEASFRHFYRITCGDGRSRVAMDAPPERENNRQYCRIASAWGAAGLHVPEVLAHDETAGFLLVTDLGAVSVDERLTAASADVIYTRALEQLTQVQALPADPALYPRYDAQRLHAELGVFAQWLVNDLLGLDAAPLQSCADLLVDSALAQPQVVIHLDWHSRNLLYTPAGQFGIVDFQDARIGPYTYDVVSLLRDCYQRFDEQRVAHWAHLYCQHAASRKLVTANFTREFDWMGIQRQLKAAGIFVRMQRRDGKPQHLPHVLPTLQRVLQVAERYAELVTLTDWLRRDVLPAAEEHLPCAP